MLYVSLVTAENPADLRGFGGFTLLLEMLVLPRGAK